MSPDNPQAAANALLDWYALSGVDVTQARAALKSARARPLSESPLPASRRRAPAKAPAAQRAEAADARAAAADAKTLTELKAAIESFQGCELKKTARSTVFADGVESAEIMLIGEAPGRDEDEQGKPFVGRAGQLLDRMFAPIGYSRQTNLFITNVIFWRPPGNREPTPGELSSCAPFIQRAIELKAPKLIVFVGGVAAKHMLATDQGVMRLRGRRLTFKPARGADVNALVMLHPAYLLRRPQDKRLAWQDLLLLEQWAGELGVKCGQRL